MKSLLVLSLLGIGVLLGPLLYSSPIKLVTQPSLPIKSFDQTPVDPKSKMVNLGNAVSLEIVYLPAGKFLMGSSAEEKAWATGPEGGATAGTERESYIPD